MDMFKAMADPTRRRILQLLSEKNLSAGEIAETYPLTSTTYPQQIPVGAKCVGAQECIALNNASDNIKIIVSLYDNNYTEHTATFELPVQ